MTKLILKRRIWLWLLIDTWHQIVEGKSLQLQTYCADVFALFQVSIALLELAGYNFAIGIF